MSFLDRLFWPREAISDIQRDMGALLRGALEIRDRINHLEIIMADNAPLLNKLADDLRTFAAGPFAAVLAENASLRSERDAARADAATARGEADALLAEDAGETSAADNAVRAFNELASPVTESPEVPVEIPVVEVPAEPVADGSADADDDIPPAA